MRLIIQRVNKADVSIGGVVKSTIGKGLLVLLGIEDSDSQDDIAWLVGKVVRMRIFSDKNDLMNLSVKDVKGEILLISQFTLHASTKKGNRPSFIKAAKPDVAIPLYKAFINALEEELNCSVKTGEFGAMMEVGLVNSGPVTIFIDSKNRE